MKTPAELIKEFANLGSRHTITLRNGEYYEGYILEMGEKSFEFAVGGSLAPETPLTIEYNSINFKSLSFYDTDEKCYKDAFLFEKIDK